jgi:hypothetical protein
MIYLPWIVFFATVVLLIWLGFKAKSEYLRRRLDEQDRARMKALDEKILEPFRQQGPEQGKAELGSGLGLRGQGRSSAHGINLSSLS